MRSRVRPGHMPPRELPKRYRDPDWVQSMQLSLDYNYAMADLIGDAGLQEDDLDTLAPRLAAFHQDLAARRQQGLLNFLELPFQEQGLEAIRRRSKPLLEWCWDLLVVGAGDLTLGPWALHQALSHPHHNKFPMARRQHKLGLYRADSLDPDHLYGLLDGLDLRRLAINVVSVSGNNPATLARFLWIYRLLKGRLGEDKARERLVITTDPENGALRRLATQEHLTSLPIPPGVPGRFSVLSAVGLFPAGVTGLNLEELLAGARFMDQHLRNAEPDRNIAYRLAALFYLYATARLRPTLVFMPYADNLAGITEWFCQVWSEALNPSRDHRGPAAATGSTPFRVLGTAAPPSRLFLKGPPDKLITLVAVNNFKQRLEIPDSYPDTEALSSLGGDSLNELLEVERQAAAAALARAGRPNLTLHLPEVNPFTLGQLICLLEVVTLTAAHLFGVDPFDQPAASGLTGPGYGPHRQEIAAAPPPLEKYRIA